MDLTKYFCQNCGRELEPNQWVCPFCGYNGRKIGIPLSDGVSSKSALGLRQKRSGFKRFMKEIIQGWFPSRNPKLLGGVYKERIIDKERNEYCEIVKDAKSGEVIHEKCEPLSWHKQ